MKHILLTTFFSTIALVAFAQADWDFIGAKRGLNFKEAAYLTYSNEKVCYNVPTYDEYLVPSNELNDENWTFYSIQSIVDGRKNICIPTPVYEEYKLGTTCFNAGIVTVSVGGGFLLAGAICSLSADSSNNPDAVLRVGTVLSSLGCASISFSVPLLCWGDFMKRNANWKLKLYSH